MITVRHAGRHELAEVLGVWRAADAQPTATDDERALAGLLDHDPRSLLVAVDGERVVATMIAAWDGWRGAFYRLAVLPGWRRHGVARALVAEGERQLQGRGARRLAVFAVEGDDGAVAFWEAVGYRLQVDRSRLVKDTAVGPQASGSPGASA